MSFPKYEVSTMGRIRNRDTGRIMAASSNGKGALILQLRRGGASYSVAVRKLVAEAFIPNYQPGRILRHRNGDWTDCSVENLVAERRANIHWDEESSRPVRIIETGEEFPNVLELARHLDGAVATVKYAVANTGAVYKGLTFEYIME